MAQASNGPAQLEMDSPAAQADEQQGLSASINTPIQAEASFLQWWLWHLWRMEVHFHGMHRPTGQWLHRASAISRTNNVTTSQKSTLWQQHLQGKKATCMGTLLFAQTWKCILRGEHPNARSRNNMQTRPTRGAGFEIDRQRCHRKTRHLSRYTGASATSHNCESQNVDTSTAAHLATFAASNATLQQHRLTKWRREEKDSSF